MAKSLTARLGLQRWTSDTDDQQRSEFDAANAALEAKAALFGQGTLAGKGGAAAANAGTFWIINDASGGGVLGDVYYSDGASWSLVGSLDALRTRLVTAKGDILVASAAGVLAKLPLGSTGQFVRINPAAPYGIDWETITPAMIGALAVAAKAADSDLLDGIDSATFARRDQANNLAGTVNVTSGQLQEGGVRVYSPNNPPPPGMRLLAGGQAITGGTGSYNALGTFVAPASGLVTVWFDTIPSGGTTYSVSVNGSSGVTITSAGYGAGTGGHAFSGLTPGATYTVYELGAAGYNMSWWVEG